VPGDSGSGDRVGVFKSRVASVGPEVGYAFKFNDQAAYFNLRGYWEFWAQNRVEGYALFATLSIPLGPQKSKGRSPQAGGGRGHVRQPCSRAVANRARTRSFYGRRAWWRRE
jgi:hypothetical protein